MSKSLSLLAVATTAIAVSATGASAYDRDGSWRHIEGDEQRLSHDAAKVREESEELAASRHRLRWAWHNGSDRDVARAREQVHHERAELNEARRDYIEQRADIAEDRAEHRGYRRHWWWRWN